MKIIRPALALATIGAAMSCRGDGPSCGCYSRDTCSCDYDCNIDCDKYN